jgi:hypothetical protein
MSAGLFNVGKDYQLSISTPSGPLVLPITTESFSSKPVWGNIKAVTIDGVSREEPIPAGHEGTFNLDRSGSGIENFFAQAEANYYNGSNNAYTARILETISNPDGSLTQYRYDGCRIWLTEAGEASGDKQVKQVISWFASKKVQVA